jgi:hypothetical protein
VLPAFRAAIKKFQCGGVAAITTSCGFLVLLQSELQQEVPVPVVTSSLLQLPSLLEHEPCVGVLTISAARLGPQYLRASGVADDRLADVVVEGMPPDSEFSRAILGNDARMDIDRAGRDVVDAALRLQARAPRLRTLVLECTNMPPYADRIREATGWRVLSLGDSPVLLAALGAQALRRSS